MPKKNALKTLSSHHTQKLSSKWITNMRANTTKLLEET